MPEFVYAFEGYQKQFEDPDKVEPMTSSTLKEMMERFPDD